MAFMLDEWDVRWSTITPSLPSLETIYNVAMLLQGLFKVMENDWGGGFI